MACRRLAVAFFAAATCAALLLAASASSSPLPPPPAGAVQRDVGDDAGYWTETVPPAGDATETLSQWAERQRWHVGDVLDFKRWNRTVLLLASRGDYERCGAGANTTATASLPWPSVAGGDATKFELDRPGTFYFVSGVPGRCEAGQRMAVRVVVSHSGVAPPPPANVAFKFKVTSAWLWVATVGVFVGVLM